MVCLGIQLTNKATSDALIVAKKTVYFWTGKAFTVPAAVLDWVKSQRGQTEGETW